MKLVQSAILAFSSFSKIPMPQIEWREENMRYMMGFFPIVGLSVGLVAALWVLISRLLGFGTVLFGAGLALVPVLVTGGMHLDGFCDVVDAQSSHAEPPRKREILKDPHAGAFASIGVAAYLIAYAAFASELDPTWTVAALVCGVHVTSRCLSGIATLMYPTSKSKGMLSMFHESGVGSRVPIALVIELVVCTACMMWVSPLAATAMLVVALVCAAALWPFAKTQFGGMSGDLAGFFLQVAELLMIVAIVVVSKVVGL